MAAQSRQRKRACT